MDGYWKCIPAPSMYAPAGAGAEYALQRLATEYGPGLADDLEAVRLVMIASALATGTTFRGFDHLTLTRSYAPYRAHWIACDALSWYHHINNGFGRPRDTRLSVPWPLIDKWHALIEQLQTAPSDVWLMARALLDATPAAVLPLFPQLFPEYA